MNIELLSPVGGWPHLVAAVNNGADAVYMGGTLFNARIYADNFTNDDLPEAINYAHKHNVKVYITLNTLIKDSELVRAFEYANHLYEIGADALILQDMGLARLIHKYLPDFPIHLSTQGSVYNTHAIETAKTFGFSRIVPARELTLAEIRKFCKAASANDIEVECFVHGALCMCYSGQCQMSRGLSTKGDSRSGNRGTCAQPCRQLYTDENGEKSYALSPKDICFIEHLPELIEAGVDSFKIEGRIKTPEYVAIVTRIYRKYIDKYLELRKNNDAETSHQAYSVQEKDLLALKQAFNRGGFTDGYLFGNPEQKILSGASPKNQGIYLGKVVAVIDSEYKVDNQQDRSAVRGALRRDKNLVCIQLTNGNISMGDGVEFLSETPHNDNSFIGSAATAQHLPIGSVTTYVRNLGDNMYLLGDFDRGVSIGDNVYKVTDAMQLAGALEVPEKKLPVTFLFTARIGQYLSLVMTDVKAGFSTEIISDHIVESAIKAPTDEDRIIAQLCRLGDTPYAADWTCCDIELDDNAMVPVSLINRMRREAADRLLEHRLNAIKDERQPLSRAELDVIESGEQLGHKTLDSDIQTSTIPIPLEKFMQAPNDKLGKLPYILNISKGNLDKYIEDNFDSIAEAVKPTGILIGNLGWIKEFRDAGVKVYGDYGLNIFNNQSRLAFEDLGVEMYAPSHESGICDKRGLPLMITEHPIPSEYLVDRKGAKHRIQVSDLGDKYMIF